MVNRFAWGGILDIVADLVKRLEAVILLPEGVWPSWVPRRIARTCQWSFRPTPLLSTSAAQPSKALSRAFDGNLGHAGHERSQRRIAATVTVPWKT
jgi:hypothetical protein